MTTKAQKLRSSRYTAKAKLLRLEKESLRTFINDSKLLRVIDARLARATNLQIVASDQFVDAYLQRLYALGISNVQELNELLASRLKFVEQFAKQWFLGPRANTQSVIPKGIGVSFLCWAVALEKSGPKGFASYVSRYMFNKQRDAEKTARDLKGAYDATERALAA